MSADADVQRRIDRVHSFRFAAVCGVVIDAFLVAMDLGRGSASALVPVVALVALLVLVVVQTRMIRSYARTRHLNWRADQLELAAKAIRENTRRACSHASAEPVDLRLTGERVAWVCPDCNAELPAGWAPAAQPPSPAACECPDETRDTVWVHVPERATWVASYCAACGRGTGTITSTGSVRPSGTAALSGTGALSAKATTWDDVAYPSEAAQHFAQLARVGRERCIGSCPMCEERDRQRAADESMRQWIEEGRWTGNEQ